MSHPFRYVAPTVTSANPLPRLGLSARQQPPPPNLQTGGAAATPLPLQLGPQLGGTIQLWSTTNVIDTTSVITPPGADTTPRREDAPNVAINAEVGESPSPNQQMSRDDLLVLLYQQNLSIIEQNNLLTGMVRGLVAQNEEMLKNFRVDSATKGGKRTRPISVPPEPKMASSPVGIFAAAPSEDAPSEVAPSEVATTQVVARSTRYISSIERRFITMRIQQALERNKADRKREEHQKKKDTKVLTIPQAIREYILPLDPYRYGRVSPQRYQEWRSAYIDTVPDSEEALVKVISENAKITNDELERILGPDLRVLITSVTHAHQIVELRWSLITIENVSRNAILSGWVKALGGTVEKGRTETGSSLEVSDRSQAIAHQLASYGKLGENRMKMEAEARREWFEKLKTNPKLQAPKEHGPFPFMFFYGTTGDGVFERNSYWYEAVIAELEDPLCDRHWKESTTSKYLYEGGKERTAAELFEQDLRDFDELFANLNKEQAKLEEDGRLIDDESCSEADDDLLEEESEED